MDIIKTLLTDNNVKEDLAVYLAYGILIALIIILCIIANFITKKVVLKIITRIIRNNKFTWDDILLERKVFHKLSHIVPAIIIFSFASSFPDYEVLIGRAAFVYMFVVIILVINAFLTALNDIYNTFEVSKVRPIKGYIQVVKIALFIFGGIILISTLIGQNPLILISGLGALSAVLMLVFKDSILGLVAGVQLSANDMVRVGDWIEMPKYNADGDVFDITLNTVKIRNFDKTVTMVPSYAFISDSFKNWRGMQETGGRRIKRSIYIDISSIKFLSQDMIDEFKKIQYLTDYIADKEQEIEAHNRELGVDLDNMVNGRHLTNIGTYRIYIENYLKNHKLIHKGLIAMVRQLAPGEYGLPLEIYAFTSDTRWLTYEAIQADIFDHVLAIAPEFGLRVFQNPTGSDMRQLSASVSTGRLE